MMAKISELAGLDCKCTNHSLRATSASRIFTWGPRKDNCRSYRIAEVTGHKSLVALRQYERTTESQFKAVGESISHMERFSTAVIERPAPAAIEKPAILM